MSLEVGIEVPPRQVAVPLGGVGDAILVAMTVETEPASDLSECRQARSSGVMFTVSRSWWQEAWQKS